VPSEHSKDRGVAVKREVEVEAADGRRYVLRQEGTQVRIVQCGFGWRAPSVELGDLRRALELLDS